MQLRQPSPIRSRGRAFLLVMLMLALVLLPRELLADVDDQTQIVLLTNYLVTGNYAIPQRPQITRVSIYRDYALVQLNAALPTPAPSPSMPASPSALSPPSGAAPATPSPTPAPAANASRTPAAGPTSYVALKTHRWWVYLFSKSGSYGLNDLISAGVPRDVAAELVQFGETPRPLPSPSG